MIEERYLAATQSSHLRDEAHKIGHVDLLKASGMSSRNIASHYMRLVSKPSRESIERFYYGLVHVAEQRKLVSGEDAVGIAIDWLLQQNCAKCSGAGVVMAKGVEVKCNHCGGEGRRKQPANKCAQILIDYVIQCKNAHASRMMQKLR